MAQPGGSAVLEELLGHQIAAVSSGSDERAAEYAQLHQIPYFTSQIGVLVSRDDLTPST